jgi:hypothetical protein
MKFFTNILHIHLTILLLVLSVTGCQNFLEVKPFSSTDPDEFIVDQASAEQALIGVYNILTAGSVNGEGNSSTFRSNLLFMLNGGTDELVNNSQDIETSAYTTSSFTPANSNLAEAWLFFWAGIQRANFLIEQVPNADFDNEARRTQIIAEARFLRGIYFQYLAWMYGDAPVVLSTRFDDSNLERAPLEEVYQVIEADLTHAFNNLPETSNSPGKATKWSAAGYLAKMYLYLASCRDNQVGAELGSTLNSFDWVNASDMYAKAYDINSQIIGQKSLTPEYVHLFRTETNDNTNDEVLFAAEASQQQSVIIIYVNGFIPQGNVNRVGGGYGGVRPSIDLLNKYDRDHDLRVLNNITGNLGGNPNVLEKETLEGIEYFIPRSLPDTIGPNYGAISIGKWRYPVPGSYPITNWASTCNLQLIRYADILLMQAELEYQYNGDEATARTYLTQVRDRAAGFDPTNLAALETNYRQDDFMDELMDERSRELCFETWRRIDLIRTGRMTSTIENVSTEGHPYMSNNIALKNNYQPPNIWFPISESEMATNPGFVQNPGY